MPEAIGLVLLGEEIGSYVLFASVTAAQAAGAAVLVGSSIGLQVLTAPKNLATAGLSAANSPDGQVPLRQAIAPRTRGYGRARLAGVFVLFEANGADSYDVMAFHHGQISAVVGYYLQDDVVEIDGSGFVQEQGDGRYAGNNIKIETRLGLDTETSYADVVSALSSIWTTAHVGDGLASAALVCLGVSDPSVFTQIYPRGLPQLSIVADLAPLYDARDASQSRADPSTWKVTSNPVVQILDFLTNTDSGMGLDYEALVAPVIAALNAEADICDESVTLASGAIEARYTSNGSFTLDTDPATTIAALLDTCDGWLSENGDGTLALKVGKYRPTTFTIETRHIRGFALQKGTANEEAVNEIDMTYTEPLADYKTLPGDPWRDEDDISTRGKTLSQTFDLPWVQSHTQARRLSKRKMAKANVPLRGTIKTTLWGMQALGERWIVINAPGTLDDFNDLVIEVQSLKIDLLNALVTIDFIRVDPDTIDAWDPATEDGVTPTIPDKVVYVLPPTPTGLAVVVSQLILTIFIVTFDDPGRSDLGFEIRYRVAGSGSDFTTSPRQYSVSSGSPGKAVCSFILGVVDPAQHYEVQMRSFAPTGPASDWSASAFT